jgi:predicted MFS family arabinose efflux permease
MHEKWVNGQRLKKLYGEWLIGPKLLNFFTFLLQYSFYAFRSTFLKEYLGFGSHAIGWTFSLMAGSSFLGISVWSRLADRTGRPKSIYLAIIVASWGLFMSLLLKPDFRITLGILSLYSFCAFALTPILSRTVLHMLATSGLKASKSAYGRQVIFGSFAYVFVNLVLGQVIHRDGQASTFWILSIAAASLFAVVWECFPTDHLTSSRKVLVGSPATEGQKAIDGSPDTDSHREASLSATAAKPESFSAVVSLPERRASKRQWVHLFKGNPRFVMFLGVIFLTGCARTIMSAFLPLYYKDIQLSSVEQSLLLVSGVTFEMAGFFWGPRILGLGPYWMLVLAQMIMVLRAWAYVVMAPQRDSFWLLFVIELLKGAAFGLTHLAGVKIACDSAPPGLETTAQGFYEGFYAQLPSVFSAPLGGWAIDTYGFPMLFLATAVGISISCTTVIVTFAYSRKLTFKSVQALK